MKRVASLFLVLCLCLPLAVGSASSTDKLDLMKQFKVADTQAPATAEPTAPPTPEPTATPEPTPQPTPEPPGPAKTIPDAAAACLAAVMADLAGTTEDPWQKFLFQQGVAEIEMNLEKFDISLGKALPVTFLVASGGTDLKSQPEYETDPASWLQGVVASMKTPDTKVKASLTITQQGDVYQAELGEKGVATLQKTIKGLAGKAKKGLASDTVVKVLVDFLMPLPGTLPKKAPKKYNELEPRAQYQGYLTRNGLSAETHPMAEALLYGLRGHKLDASGGPESLVLTYRAAKLADYAKAAYAEAEYALRFEADAKQRSAAQLEPFYGQQVALLAVQKRYDKKTESDEESYTFSLLDLPQALSPQAFYTHLDASFDAQAKDNAALLLDAAKTFPDYPAVEPPKSGVIDGESKGSRLRLKAPKDGYHRCVSVVDDKGNFISTSYLGPGTTASLLVPKGNYTLVEGIGSVWYGNERLFGDDGWYSQGYEIEIKGKNWILTLTYRPIEDITQIYYFYPLSYEEAFGHPIP